MKTKIALALLGLCSGAAIAADQSSDLYAGISSGMHRVESQGFDDRAPTLKVLGGYNFNQYLAIEAGYSKLFETSDTIEGTRVKIDGNTLELGAKLTYPIGERFSGYGRLGRSYYDMKASFNDPDLSVDASENSDAMTWALGGRVKMNKRMDLNGEYARILITDADIDFLSLGLAYSFGK